MKKLGNKNILYAVWIILCAATAFLGGFGHSMLINYAFLAVMGLLILIVDRHGLSKICRITKDLKGITETFSEAEAKGTQGEGFPCHSNPRQFPPPRLAARLHEHIHTKGLASSPFP